MQKYTVTNFSPKGTLEPQIVDFTHPELCKHSDPFSCRIGSVDIPIRKTWIDLLEDVSEWFLKTDPQLLENYISTGGRPFLMDEVLPGLRCRTLSNGKVILVNYGIDVLVRRIGRVCMACNVNLKDVTITYIPKSGGSGSLIKAIDDSPHHIPASLLDALNSQYPSGFRFDITYIKLLSNISGINIDAPMQRSMKHIMFHREDDVYFLLDSIASPTVRSDILKLAATFLNKYGCFEISEFYKLCRNDFSWKYIRNINDFERFYQQIESEDVRCVAAPQIGNRIVRFNTSSVGSLFQKLAQKIISVITTEYYGSCSEDELHEKFCAFSPELLGKIIKIYAIDKLIRVEINDSICYQTFEAFSLPENFSEILSDSLERLSEIRLEPTQEILHTAISLKLGVNFKAEFNLPDWDTYRRLVAAFYKAEPRREWKHNIFGEVAD